MRLSCILSSAKILFHHRAAPAWCSTAFTAAVLILYESPRRLQAAAESGTPYARVYSTLTPPTELWCSVTKPGLQDSSMVISFPPRIR